MLYMVKENVKKKFPYLPASPTQPHQFLPKWKKKHTAIHYFTKILWIRSMYFLWSSPLNSSPKLLWEKHNGSLETSCPMCVYIHALCNSHALCIHMCTYMVWSEIKLCRIQSLKINTIYLLLNQYFKNDEDRFWTNNTVNQLHFNFFKKIKLKVFSVEN